MLIQFTVGNYLSFKEKVTLNMEATSIKEHPENVFESPDGRYRLLKSVAIYGANGSGKSNLSKAMQMMVFVIRNNIQLSSADGFSIVPFRLNIATEDKPTFFESIFLLEGVKYRYGFELDNLKIHSEWLFETKKNKEKALFIREGDNIEIYSSFKEGEGLEQKTGDNKLFLSVVDQFNGAISKKMIRWLTSKNSHFSAFDLEHDAFKKITRQAFSNHKAKQLASSLYKNIGLGFKDFFVTIDTQKNQENDATIKLNVSTVHNKYDSDNNIVGEIAFDLLEDESKGTNKLFDCSAMILASLEQGSTLSLDELDASLHPLMTLAITKLYNSTENNPNSAQLIFTTHDTNLLSKGGFRRDQIYFVEKDNYEASHLYSLADFKVRNDASYEKDYIQGRYGAIPFIGDFSKLLSDGK